MSSLKAAVLLTKFPFSHHIKKKKSEMMIQFEHVAQNSSNWPLPFPLKGLKWTKVHPGSTFLYTFYMNNMKEIQEVCVWEIQYYRKIHCSEIQWSRVQTPHLQRWPAAEIWSTRELAAGTYLFTLVGNYFRALVVNYLCALVANYFWFTLVLATCCVH